VAEELRTAQVQSPERVTCEQDLDKTSNKPCKEQGTVFHFLAVYFVQGSFTKIKNCFDFNRFFLKIRDCLFE
jgi:hypothetical protein